jgi:predicted lipoprotein with Yx(FWY)xxD motif
VHPTLLDLLLALKTVIPAKAGIQKCQRNWIPGQARNDNHSKEAYEVIYRDELRLIAKQWFPNSHVCTVTIVK